MSSLRNAVARRNHRERAQPLERSKWGLLEKHKDYSLRAQDYNEKKRQLKVLRQKAADRNPDEFSHSMLSGKTRKGQKIATRGNTSLDHQTVQLLKTQDQGYLQTVLSKTVKDIQRLQESIQIDSRSRPASLINHGVKRSRTVFQDKDRVRQRLASSAQQAEVFVGQDVGDDLEKDVPETVSNLQTRTSKLKVREQSLRTALTELDLQRAKISSSTGGTNHRGMRWRLKERRR